MSAPVARPAQHIHERLSFDLKAGAVVDGPRRYVIMRADVLMGAFDGLPDEVRAEALASLGRSVTRFGGDSVRTYLSEVGAAALLHTMVNGSASLGWGRWKFRRSAGRIWVRVLNSPYASGTTRHEGRACHAIAGMIQAVAQALWSSPANAWEVRCACSRSRGRHACLLVATPAHAS